MLEKNNILALEISNMVNEAKNNLAKEINKSITYVYWNIGRIIVKHENEDNNRLEYGKEVLKELSKELTKLLGKGYSYTNLTYMRWFYNTYPDYNKISESLSWSHYIELITIKDEDKRNFYEKECINSNWSVRELQRQLDTSLFERLLLSDGKANGEIILDSIQHKCYPLGNFIQITYNNHSEFLNTITGEIGQAEISAVLDEMEKIDFKRINDFNSILSIENCIPLELPSAEGQTTKTKKLVPKLND